MILTDSPLTESPKKIDLFDAPPFSISLSLEDDEENIGFDNLEKMDDEDDDFEEEEEDEEDEDYGDEEDDDLDDDGFDDEDDEI